MAFFWCFVETIMHLVSTSLFLAVFSVIFLFCVVSCITDMIDGQIARKFNMISTLGKILDPVADKLTQFTLTLCLSVKHPVLRYLLVLFVIKEGFQCIAGLYHLFNRRMLPGALPAGKICTTVLFCSLTGLIFFPDLS